MDTTVEKNRSRAVPAASTPQTADERRRFYAEISASNLTPLWEVLHALVPTTPKSPCVPAHWRYADIRPSLSGVRFEAEMSA